MKRSNRQLLLLVLCLGLAWGFTYIALDRLMLSLHPIQVLTLRWQIVALLFLMYYLICKRKPFFPRSYWFQLAAIAITEAIICPLTQFFGINYTSASIAAIFEAIVPAVSVLVGALFFRRRTSLLGIFSIFLAIAGVVVYTVFAPDYSADGKTIGYFLLVIFVLSGSFYNHLSNTVGKDINAVDITAAMAFTGAIVHTILHFCFGFGSGTYIAVFTDPHLLGGIVFTAAVGTFTGNVLFNRAMAITSDPALTANTVAGLTASVAVVSSVLLLNSSSEWYIWTGLAVTLIGVMISGKTESQKQSHNKQV